MSTLLNLFPVPPSRLLCSSSGQCPHPWGLKWELPTPMKKGWDSALPLGDTILWWAWNQYERPFPGAQKDTKWDTEADHLLLCGRQTVLVWIWTDIFLLPCSATDSPAWIRIINGYITVEPQPWGHGQSRHTHADTDSAHQLFHSLFLLLLILTLHMIRLHWNKGGAKLQGSHFEKQKRNLCEKTQK